MPITFTQVDSFAHKPFAGNPAAVIVLRSFPTDAFMQSVAMEMSLSETAFVVPDGDGFNLRWFTPVDEVDLCGHATLAAAHTLFEADGVPGDVARFHTKSGDLLVTRSEDGWLTMDFPAETPRQKPRVSGIENIVGAPVEWYGENRMDAFVELADSGWLRALDPDMTAIARMPVRGLIVTARSDRDDTDFISRFFAPALGVPEDPVTGSAHCALAPYWADRLGKTDLVGYQASPRGGLIRVSHRDDRVLLSGTAVTTIRGELQMDPE